MAMPFKVVLKIIIEIIVSGGVLRFWHTLVEDFHLLIMKLVDLKTKVL